MRAASGSASGPPGGGGGGFDGTDWAGWQADWCGIIEVICDAYREHGPDNSEKSYVDRVFYKLYELGVPAVRERPLLYTVGGVSVSCGRIDLEIAQKYLFEFKIVPPTPKNLRKNSRQLMRYLRFYAQEGIPLQRAALVYLYANEVRIVEVSTEDDKKHRYSPYGRNPDSW